MANILIIAGLDSSLLRFRGDLIKEWLKHGHKVSASASTRNFEKNINALGAEFFDIPLKRVALNPFADLYLLFSLTKLIKVIKPDYLFLYTIKPVIYGSMAAYFFCKIRVFSMITGLGFVFINTDKRTSIIRKIITFLYRFTLKRSEKVFFQNTDDIIAFRELHIVKPNQIILVNGSGVNLDYFFPAAIKIDQVKFLLIARLLKEKGIFEFIEAARIVKNKYPQIRFDMIVWAFEKDPSAIRSEQLEAWKDEGIVDIYSETDDVRPYIADSSVYVLPSYREGTPRTVLEAMAMGRAIITTDAPGCRETVVEGVNGYLVPVKDSIALARAMEKFIQEPELINKMGKASRKLAEEKFDVRKVNEVINQAMGLS